MIEGSLSDVSLPGLLQFLATESNKSYKVSLVSGGQKGDLHVCDGEILSANFGLLEGNDALTELLFWPDGTFSVELLNAEQKAAIKGNLKIILKQVNTFADQMVYLREAQVGLNSEIVPSLSFGTQEWQEALARQPLFKEDYAVLGWITDGRTMRQAMREFNFDVVKATSSLFRLLSTGSVEILRPTLVAEEDAGGEIPMSGLAAILDSMAPSDDGPDESPKTEEVTAASDNATFDASPEAVVAEPESEAPAKSSAKSKSKAEAKSEAKPESKSESKSDSKPEPPAEAKPSPTVEPAPLPSSRLVNDPQEPKSNDVGTATGATFTAVSGTLELAEEPEVEEVLPPPSAPAPAESAAAPVQRDYEVITSDSLPAVGSKEFDEILAKAQKASEEPQNTNVVQQAVTAQIHLPTSFRTSSDKLPVVSAGLTNELPIAKAAALARQTLEMDTSALAVADTSGAANPFITSGDGEPAATASVATAPLPTKDSSSAWAAAVRDEPKPQSSAATEDNAEKRLFDIVRTDPLPIVAIDIERLFQTSFHVSPYGHVSLGNDVLDSDLQKILQDFKQGKNFITVATEEQMQPAQVLHHCKFCLERGYIDPPDAVASLTADLLLGRVELEQYLLQRRRITGDELRDVMEVSKQKGIKLTDLLVKLGFMTASDWDRLCQEKERFARR